MKISVIGAGNVGSTVANVIAQKDFCKEVVLLDIKKGVSEGKGLDMWETSPILSYNTRITGVTNNYRATKGSDITIITSGIPRKPGMSRDDLIGINAGIVKSVTEQVIKYSPKTIIIVVANPLDVMTYCAFVSSKFKSTKVFGMAGVLDTARYRSFLAMELNVSPKDIQALLMGGHGDTMVPLPRYTTVAGIPVTELVSKKRLEEIVQRTKTGGGELVKLMGTSAWYAPGAAAAQMAEAIAKDEKRIFPVCAWLNGEYGLKNVFLGVPVILGKNGIEKIIEVDLNKREMKLLKASSDHVKAVMKVLEKMDVLDKKKSSKSKSKKKKKSTKSSAKKTVTKTAKKVTAAAVKAVKKVVKKASPKKKAAAPKKAATAKKVVVKKAAPKKAAPKKVASKKAAPKKAAPKKAAPVAKVIDKKVETLNRIKAKAKTIDFGTIGKAGRSKDDLKMIKGIGAFIEEKLNALGIKTFEQVSKFNSDIEDKVNLAIEFFPGRVKRDDWKGQAKKLKK